MKIKEIILKDIIPYENNPFVHNEEELNRIKSSITDNEYINPIILDKNNTIIAGHLRYKALCELNGLDTPISVIDASHLTDKQARKYRILDNKRPEMDIDLMEQEITSLYQELDKEKISLETGINVDDILSGLTDLEKENEAFLHGEEIPHKEIATKNTTEIKRIKEEAEIRFTLSIEQYDLYTALKKEVFTSEGTRNAGEFFMSQFLKSAEKFGIKLR